MLDRFDIVVDQDAEPADWDEAIVEFLDRVVELRLAANAAQKDDKRVIRPSKQVATNRPSRKQHTRLIS
jgi:hypothetical protein